MRRRRWAEYRRVPRANRLRRAGARTGLSAAGATVRRNGGDEEREKRGFPVLFGVRVAAGSQMAVADLGHPVGTCQVDFHRLAGSFRHLGGVDAENEPGHLVLVDAFFIGVEEASVGFVVLVVVFGDAIEPGGLIGTLGTGFGLVISSPGDWIGSGKQSSCAPINWIAGREPMVQPARLCRGRGTVSPGSDVGCCIE